MRAEFSRPYRSASATRFISSVLLLAEAISKPLNHYAIIGARARDDIGASTRALRRRAHNSRRVSEYAEPVDSIRVL